MSSMFEGRSIYMDRWPFIDMRQNTRWKCHGDPADTASCSAPSSSRRTSPPKRRHSRCITSCSQAASAASARCSRKRRILKGTIDKETRRWSAAAANLMTLHQREIATVLSVSADPLVVVEEVAAAVKDRLAVVGLHRLDVMGGMAVDHVDAGGVDEMAREAAVGRRDGVTPVAAPVDGDDDEVARPAIVVDPLGEWRDRCSGRFDKMDAGAGRRRPANRAGRRSTGRRGRRRAPAPCRVVAGWRGRRRPRWCDRPRQPSARHGSARQASAPVPRAPSRERDCWKERNNRWLPPSGRAHCRGSCGS